MTDEDEHIDKYLEEVRTHSRIPEKEDQLAQLAESGDANARSKLVTAHLARAAEIGLRLAPTGMSRLAAIQESNLVLTRLVSQGVSNLSARLGPAIEDHFSTFT